jgi:preprotein translocase subunit YajC
MGFAIAWFVLLAAVFFWFIVRPQRRRVAAHRAFVAALDVGDEVVTTGGIYGTVRALDESAVELEVAPAVVIKVARAAIVQRVGALPAAGDAGDD